MATVKIEIDGQTVEAKQDRRLLWAALDAGIFIPHLCAGEDHNYHPASCRLCFVEVEGMAEPVTSCTTMVREGMVVKTRSERVDRLVRSGFALLMSNHKVECKVCPAKEYCALLEISRQRKIPLRSKRLPNLGPDLPIDDSHPEYGMDPNKCVLCGRCVCVANHVIETRVLDFHQRGLATVVSTFDGQPLASQDLTDFDQVVAACPVGALFVKNRNE